MGFRRARIDASTPRAARLVPRPRAFGGLALAIARLGALVTSTDAAHQVSSVAASERSVSTNAALTARGATSPMLIMTASCRRPSGVDSTALR